MDLPLGGAAAQSPRVPWKETRIMDQRVQFIAAVQDDSRGNFKKLCERFGISRQKGYKWVERYETDGPRGLEDRKPVPQLFPHATPGEVVDAVVALRKEHPFDGPKKLRARLLVSAPEMAVPAASTIGEILGRNGLVRPRKRRLRVPPSQSLLEAPDGPNDLWCTDFKGHFLCGDRERCYPLTITDDATRYLIKCEGLHAQTGVQVIKQFELAFAEFGLPRRIRSDNGSPFATRTVGGLSALSVWWIRLGIAPERIEPGQPQQNGRHERMHRTLKEQTAKPPSATFVAQQRAFDGFRGEYNDHRPHEALDQTPPARHYEPSRRVLPGCLGEPGYDDKFEVRRVSHQGRFTWKGKLVGLTSLLAGQPVGLRAIEEDTWELWYGPVQLGRVSKTKDGIRLSPILGV